MLLPDFMRRILGLLPARSVRRRVAVGVAWLSTANAVQSVAGLLVGVGLARTLGVSGFGEWGVLNSTIVTLGVFAGLGLGVTATKYVAELRESDPTRLGRVLVLLDRVVFISTASIAGGLFLLAPLVAGPILQASHLETELRIASVMLLANVQLGVQTGVLNGLEAFRNIALINTVRALVSIPATILGAVAFGVTGAITVAALVAGGTWLFTAITARRACRNLGIHRQGGGQSTDLHLLWHFSLPALLSSVMVAPPMWLATVLLVNQPGGYAQVGAFTAANQWRQVITFVPNVIGVTILPILSSLFGQGARSGPRLLAGAVLVSALVAAPIALVLVLTSTFVMRVNGPGFEGHAGVLVIIAITSLVIAAQLPVGSMVAASGRMWLGAAMNLGWSVVFLGTAAILIVDGWGALGLALAYLVAYAVHSVWSFAFAAAISGPRRWPGRDPEIR